MSKVADYIFGGTEADRQAAELEYALGCLGREIELNAKLRDENAELRRLLANAKRPK